MFFSLICLFGLFELSTVFRISLFKMFTLFFSTFSMYDKRSANKYSKICLFSLDICELAPPFEQLIVRCFKTSMSLEYRSFNALQMKTESFALVSSNDLSLLEHSAERRPSKAENFFDLIFFFQITNFNVNF